MRVVDEPAVRRVRALLRPRRLGDEAELFAALGDATRLTILAALAQQPLCVCDLASLTGVSQSAVSHQLRMLRERRLVSFSRDGKRAVYRLADRHVATLLEQAREHADEGREAAPR